MSWRPIEPLAAAFAAFAALAAPPALRAQADTARAAAPAAPAASVVGTVELEGFAALWAAAVYVVGQPAGAGLDTSAAVLPVVGQRRLRFRPSVVAAPRGATVVFRNDDPLVHSVFSPGDQPFDLGRFLPGTERRHRFAEPGIALILCHLHPEMAAYVVVAPSRAVTLTDAAGRFSLSGLRSGPATLHIWHPMRPSKTVRLDLEPGRATVVNVRL